jgi:serralysin
VIDSSELGAGDSATFNGTAETNGTFNFLGGAGTDIFTGGALADSFIGGAGNDTLNGGGGNDTLTGGLGSDTLNGGTGNNVFAFNAVAESTGAGYDKVVGFDFSRDVFSLPFTVTGVDAAATGALSSASFDNDLTNAINASNLAAGHAVLFNATSGTLAGHSFMVVDANNTAGYQVGLDHVVELITPKNGTLGTANFAAMA